MLARGGVLRAETVPQTETVSVLCALTHKCNRLKTIPYEPSEFEGGNVLQKKPQV